jgi:hypothetical protein
MLICPCIVNQFLKMFQKDYPFFVQYFIPCKRLYMFHPKHVDFYWNIFKNWYKFILHNFVIVF